MEDDVTTGLNLDDEQRCAAFEDRCDVAVLAGAGCGKTTTLVARYLHLLAQGLSPAQIAAITFTERAGEEMRARIRGRLRAYLAGDPPDRAAWLEHYIALDGAPIGTIHGLCARLLRAHPAEARLDPLFVVLEESQAAPLVAEAAERALAWATRDAAAVQCFRVLGGPRELREVLTTLLRRRLDVGPALARSGGDVGAHWREIRREWLLAVLGGPAWQEHLATLSGAQPLVPGDALDGLRIKALEAVHRARLRAGADDWGGALAALAEGLVKPGRVGSQANWGLALDDVRAALRGLAGLFEAQVRKPTARADPALDDELAAAWPGLVSAFHQAARDYARLKEERRVVDFDDLEDGALRLLGERPEVAALYHEQFGAILVDEFQDTNERQRRLLEALLGAPVGQSGRLFVVGDAKQSIYRFRGADVEVFRRVEREVTRAGGRTVALDRTHRAHGDLVELLNRLLAGVLGTADDAAHLYAVPFAPLRAWDERGPARFQPPHVELHLGLADTADEGRRAAGAALAARLQRLHASEGMAWGEAACLFRASTDFAVYEEAFEEAGIPYVTVAGAGFYGRPEVRDLVNALRALADPGDDLAMAGLLRSPAIGLEDASLFLLRWGPDGASRHLWQALRGELAMLPLEERERAARAAAIVSELSAQVGRQPVAAVLKRFLDLTAYPAILGLSPHARRAERNVQKLLADAQRSGAVGVGDFLDYVQTLADVAAREGEAPPEGGQAVRLMTVHKAKGLEFPVVVIADAAHDDAPRAPGVLLHPEWGLVIRLGRSEGADRREGLLHCLARSGEAEMQDAEERRLLYVAATRAREKLLVSAHVKPGRPALSCQGWLERLAAALGEEEALASVVLPPGGSEERACWGGRVALVLHAPLAEGSAQGQTVPEEAVAGPSLAVDPAAAALAEPYDRGQAALDREALPEHVWRVMPKGRPRAPAWVVGKLVHVGLGLWRFPDDKELDGFLEVAAHSAGLVAGQQIAAGVAEARRLLQRFAQSDLKRQLDQALERHHELPYATGQDPAGRMDLLCRLVNGEWWLVDFKTDDLRGEWALAEKTLHYGEQLWRYGQAVEEFLAVRPKLFLCFLDYEGAVAVRDVAWPAA